MAVLGGLEDHTKWACPSSVAWRPRLPALSCKLIQRSSSTPEKDLHSDFQVTGYLLGGIGKMESHSRDGDMKPERDQPVRLAASQQRNHNRLRARELIEEWSPLVRHGSIPLPS